MRPTNTYRAGAAQAGAGTIHQTSDQIIGIDLGTTNSVVAVLEGDQPRVIPNSEGSGKTPSIVSILENGEVVVGEVARRQSTVAAHRTISSIKRLMGRTMSDVDALGLNPPYEITSEMGHLVVRVGENSYTPAQISAFILEKLKASAEEYLGTPVTKAIITVPAYFDDLQRQATREAGRLAGLEVLRLVNEPTAAAMAYGLGRSGRERVAVYDFGGGTFDVTILDISDSTFEVLTSTGDTHLGGDDIDELLIQHMLQQFAASTNGAVLELDAVTYRRLKDAAEKAKCELSVARQTVVQLPFLTQHEGRPVHLELTITRQELEEMIYPLVEQTLDCCRSALKDCELTAEDVDKVILVGGTSRIPLVQEMVEDFFGLSPFKGINPDEIVALGAATQAGVMAGKLKEVLLLDVTPHSLGVEVTDNRMARIIEKNSTIPIKQARLFTTTEDGQEMVSIHVLQGESEKSSENRSLGKFTLTGLQSAKAGIPRVQVTFQINADGMVEVTAEDLVTHQQKSITLTISNEEAPLPSGRERASVAARRRRPRRPARPAPAPAEVLVGQNPSATAARRMAQGGAGAVAPPVIEVPTNGAAPKGGTGGSPGSPGAAAPPGAPVSPAAKDSAQPYIYEHPTEPGLDESVFQEPQDKPGQETLSEKARWAISYIRQQATSATAYDVYLRAYEELRAYAEKNPHDVDTAEAAIRVLITLGEREAAQRLLTSFAETTSSNPSRVAALYDLFLAKFPTDEAVSAEYARNLADSGKIEDAIARLEGAVGEEGGTEAQIEALIQLYRTRLASHEDPGTQFKLVKLLIRGNRIDEAINLLQRLVNNESYRARSLKILGLCFWQKGLHYLAWQKFQQLPVSDELKDILYRLSADMEDTDQLLNAKVVLQHLKDADPEYRDVSDRLARVEQMIRLEASDREGNLTPSIFLTLKDSRFAILEEINRGSMGIVYRAKDKVLDEIVALKILNDYMTGDPVAVERFKREARAAKRLSHPNIVRIHDMFEYGSKKLLSMEFIEGVDLKKVIHDRGTLPVWEIVAVCRAVCDALAYAHHQNIVHRDIKPANIMITDSNVVKVTDFGIAKFLLAGPDATRSGSQIIGTPLYMSPEQIRGDAVDARSDIYSLGATLYEMATGRPPFLDGNIEYHHLHTPPASLPDSVPPVLAEVILKCLAKDPADRFQTTEAITAAFQQVV